MPDIMKFIVDEAAIESDPQGYLMQLEAWSEELARERARLDGLALTPAHWEVIRFLREYYRQHGPAEHARSVMQALERRFAGAGGRKQLYRLFPAGPVTQGSRLAGLPLPPGAVDRSFGTSH